MRRITEIILLAAVLLSAPAAQGQVREFRQSATSEGSAAPAVDEPRSPKLKAEMHRARMAFESGASMMEAKVRVERVLRERPDDVEARKLRARVLLALDRPRAANADAEHATRLAPEDGEAHLLVAEVLCLEGDTLAARQALDRAAERISEDARLHVRLAWNAAHLGLLNRAEAYARTALAQDPSFASAYYQLARVFVQQGKPDDAALILERGFAASLLASSVVRQDSLLSGLADHRRLRGHLGR